MGGSVSTLDGKTSRLLIIVHPGGAKEVYNRPICAAAVMNKNPRHCITRPDVFERPWIVVSPEALLMPGMRFYLVPKRTIRRLLKQHGILASSSNSMNIGFGCPDNNNNNNVMMMMPDLPAEISSEEPDLKIDRTRKKSPGSHGYLTLRQLLDEAPAPNLHCRASDAAKLGFVAADSNSMALHCQLVSHPRAWVSKPGRHAFPARQCKVKFKSPCVQAVYYISPYSSPASATESP